MSEYILEIQGLHKTYGKVTAVQQLDLKVGKGSVFGLLGPNGSGKTTTLAMILDVLKADSGTYRWFGEAPHHSHRQRIGAILEKPNFYPKLSGRKNLELSAIIKSSPESRIQEVLRIVGLEDRGGDSFKTYSLGMKQRLAIASALLADPELLILDEPTNGLDPQGIAEIRTLIKDIAQQGRTIILASHLLDEVEKVCNQFAVLHHGKLIYQGAVQGKQEKGLLLQVAAEDNIALEEELKQLPQYLSSKAVDDRIEVELTEDLSSAALNRHLLKKGIALEHLEEVHIDLEQKFMDILSDHKL